MAASRQADFNALRTSISALAARVRDLRRQIEIKRREREDILSAPPAKADVLGMLNRWVDGNSEAATKNLQTMLDGFLRRPDFISDEGRIGKNVALLGAVPNPNVAPTLQTAEVMLCALLGAQLKDVLPSLLDKVEWPADPGLPLAERAERVAAIDRELETLQDDERELVSQATAAGVNLAGVYYA